MEKIDAEGEVDGTVRCRRAAILAGGETRAAWGPIRRCWRLREKPLIQETAEALRTPVPRGVHRRGVSAGPHSGGPAGGGPTGSGAPALWRASPRPWPRRPGVGCSLWPATCPTWTSP
jgi:hypothetical protein